MKATKLLVVLLVLAGGLWSFTKYSTPELDDEVEIEKIEWLTIEEAMKRHETQPKYWIVDVYTDWCGWCKRMDATTFTDPHVVSEINKNYYAIKFDAEAKRDITIDGKVYKFVAEGRRGYHELAALMLNGKMSYPSIAYLSDEGKMIQTIPGFKTAEEIHPILQYFGEGTFKSVSWEDFQKSYTSPFAPE